MIYNHKVVMKFCLVIEVVHNIVLDLIILYGKTL